MKAELTFDLPEEQDLFEIYNNALKYYSTVSEINNFLRSKLKYEEINDDEYKAYEKTKEELWNILQEKGITL